MSASEAPRVMIAVLTTHERQGWPTKELAEFMIRPQGRQQCGYQHTFAHNFIPAAGARNTIANNFKDMGADWILMIDNDMSPPLNLLDAIKDAPEDAGVVVPKFYMWNETKALLTMCWGLVFPDGRKPDCQTKFIHGHEMAVVENKFYELYTCGTGCIFIRPEVFQKVPAPWFFYSYDEMNNMEVTEDINFCHKIRDHGFKIYGNGGFNVGHHHTVNLSVIAGLLYDKKSSETDERPLPVSVDSGEPLPTSCPEVVMS